MPPERNQGRKAGNKTSHRRKDAKVKKQPKQSQQEARDPSFSVSKIKGNIRQATRLLKREDLESGRRKETEQRLQELEDQLKVAQEYDARVKLEQENAVKYHGIKFFERQKLTRRIKQAKAQLEDAASGTEKSDKKTKKALTKELEALRTDLNYVLHFPKADRYIALFPDGQYASPKEAADSAAGQKRAEVRQSMKDAMAQGTLSAEPEVELELRRQQQKEQIPEEAEESEVQSEEDGPAPAQVPAWGTRWKAWKDAANQPDGPGFVAKEGAAEQEEEDDFFE